MRLLHTSDWHLGRGLHGVDLLEAQERMVDQVVETVRRHSVDGVLIAGDVYDRAVPPVAAVRLWSRALREIAAHAPVVVTPGNHDSATRLGAASDLYRDGVHVVTEHDRIGTPVVWGDEHGPVLVYPIPFLDPDVARHALAMDGEPLARSHESVMAAAMDRVRADLADRESGARAVVVAHAFVVAGQSAAPERCDSERDIRVGGVDSVPSSVFDGVDYVALGHLHGAQQVGGPHVRYAGSPLRYSFSEAAQVKQLTVVDLDADGAVSVGSVEVGQPRGMAAFAASLDELLSGERYAVHEGDWVQVTVTDAARPPAVAARVRERFPHALVVRHVPASGPLAETAGPVTRVPTSPREVAEAFVAHVTGDDITIDELSVFEQAYELARNEVRSA